MIFAFRLRLIELYLSFVVNLQVDLCRGGLNHEQITSSLA